LPSTAAAESLEAESVDVHRLDFTLIGPDVNLLSRIQMVCSTTGQRLLMSERFAALLGTSRATTIGRHELKGFPNPVPLYEPIS